MGGKPQRNARERRHSAQFRIIQAQADSGRAYCSPPFAWTAIFRNTSTPFLFALRTCFCLRTAEGRVVSAKMKDRGARDATYAKSSCAALGR